MISILPVQSIRFNKAFVILFIFSPGSIEVPVVMLVLEGGPGTVKTMTEAIKKKIPAVVIDGSGRAADIVAFAYKHTIPDT